MVTIEASTKQHISAFLDSHPQWAQKESSLEATFTFETYAQAISAVVLVAVYAESINHHPKCILGYKELTIVTSTHDLGGKISPLDIQLASWISTHIH